MSHMRVGDPVRLMRWSRWGILIAAILLGSGMVLSAAVSHSRVHQIAWSLIRGQGQLLIEGVRQGLRDADHPPSAENMNRLLTTLQDQGVRYMALLAPGSHAEAGTAWGGGSRGVRGPGPGTRARVHRGGHPHPPGVPRAPASSWGAARRSSSHSPTPSPRARAPASGRRRASTEALGLSEAAASRASASTAGASAHGAGVRAAHGP
jgi:hypothetical protein